MDTIAAISTPKGTGGIGIIRVSGDDAIVIVNKIFAPYKSGRNEDNILNMRGYTAKLGKIVFNKEILDEAIFLVFRKPYSYTGENTVEISCHGGLLVLNRVLDAVISFGARLAEPGEFTKRAVLNGKMNVIQAESVINIINAKSKNAARIAILSKEGILNEKVLKIKNKLVNILAEISVSIDYPEDYDFSNMNFSSLRAKVSDVIEDLEKLIKTYKSSQILSNGVDTVIVGKPNVGKSSIMNLLSDAEKSIITDIPGTTRDIVEETVCFDDVILNLKDTAGIRESEDLVEKIGIEKTLNTIKKAGLVLAIFDFSREISKEDINLLNLIKDIPNVIGVINKIDLKDKLDFNFLSQKIKNIVKVSAKKNIGFDILKKLIKNIVYKEISEPEVGLLSTLRQKNSASRSLDFLKEAENKINLKSPLDLIMHLLDLSLKELLFLTGEKISDTILGEVFSKFCVGK